MSASVRDARARYAVRLDVDYPAPIVDHDGARRRALDALASLPKRRQA